MAAEGERKTNFRGKFALPMVEYTVLILILSKNYDKIFGEFLERFQFNLPKSVIFAIALMLIGCIHLAEQGRRSRHLNIFFRKASGQGVVIGALVSLLVCMNQFSFTVKPIQSKEIDNQDKSNNTSISYLYSEYSMAMFIATLLYGILYLFSIDIAFVAPVIMLSLGFLQDHFTDINFILPLTAVILYFAIFMSLVKLCSRSFTIGEAVIVSQGTTLVLIDFTFLLVLKLGYGELLEGYNMGLLEHRTQESLMLSALVSSTFIISVCLSPVFYCLAYYAKTANDVLIYSLAFYIGGIMNAIAIFVPSSYVLLGMNPVSYLLSLVTVSIIALVLYWIILLIAAVLVVIWNKNCNMDGNKKVIPNIIIRKSFHIIAVLIFVPGIYYEPNFTKLAAGVAVAVLIVLEYIRIFKIYPFGDALDKYLTTFLDERDTGHVILTHIYLLTGFALPIWLFPFSAKESFCPLLPYAGIISLGFGDTFASVIGKLYGKANIPGTSKTFVGAASCFASQMFVAALILLCYNEQTARRSILWMTFGVSLTSIMEAVTIQIDNLILPAVLYASISLMLL